jgi:hypothetical protein
MVEYPGAKPDRCGVNRPLARACRNAFQPTTVCHSLAKSGLFPFSRDAVQMMQLLRLLSQKGRTE